MSPLGSVPLRLSATWTLNPDDPGQSKLDTFTVIPATTDAICTLADSSGTVLSWANASLPDQATLYITCTPPGNVANNGRASGLGFKTFTSTALIYGEGHVFFSILFHGLQLPPPAPPSPPVPSPPPPSCAS